MRHKYLTRVAIFSSVASCELSLRGLSWMQIVPTKIMVGFQPRRGGHTYLRPFLFVGTDGYRNVCWSAHPIHPCLATDYWEEFLGDKVTSCPEFKFARRPGIPRREPNVNRREK